MPGKFASPSKRRLTPLHVLNDVAPRARALEVFAHLRVWDTERNNGVLIYVQLADRECRNRRGPRLRGRVGAAEWEAVCRLMEEHFRAGRFQGGLDCRRRRHRQSAGAPLSSRCRAQPSQSQNNCLTDRLCCR